MAASVNDKITDVRNAARPNAARASSPRSAGGTTLSCDNLVGWPTASKVHFVTYQIDSSSNPVAGTQMDCYGIVSGNDITSFTVVDPTVDIGNSVNDVVEMLPTAAWAQELAEALTTLLNRDGTWKSGAALILPTIASFANATHTHTNAAGGGTLGAAAVPALDFSAQTLSNPYKFLGYLNSADNTGNANFALVDIDAELYDTNSNFDTVTNKGRYTCPVTGFYFFYWSLGITQIGGGTVDSALFKNGSELHRSGRVDTNTVLVTSNGSVVVQATAGDYFEVHSESSTGAMAISTGSNWSWFGGYLVSRT